MPTQRSTNSSKAFTAPGVRRTIVRKNGQVYTRYKIGRNGPGLGTFSGATLEEAEAAARAKAAKLAERYAAAKTNTPTLETVSGLIDAFERSTEFKRLSESTKTEWSRIMADLRKSDLGKMKTIGLKAQRAPAVLEAWHARIAEERGPRAADYRLQVVRRALNWNVKHGNIPKNPALGIAEASNSDRSDLIWEPAMREKFYAHIRAEIERVWLTMPPTNPFRAKMIMRLAAARDTFTFALNTGARREDISVFARAWINGPVISYSPRKGARRARTQKKKPRTVILPVLPPVARLLAFRDEAYGSSSPWLITSALRGGNYTANTIGSMIGDIANVLKIERTLHDGKGTFVTKLRIYTDFSDEEIARLVDWSTQDVRDIITKYVSAEAVAEAMRARMTRMKTGTNGHN